MADEPGPGLLQRFVHGDREAFETLFRQFEREAFGWILRIVRERTAAEDALVETFWRAYRGRARFDASRSFGAWLRRIATRAAIDQLNASRRRAWLAPATPDAVGRVASHDSDAARDGRVLSDAIARAFHALPPKLRAVAMLALVEGEPIAEIADALDLPVGTVKSRLFRATRLLRQELTRLGVHT